MTESAATDTTPDETRRRPRLVIVEGDGWREALTAELLTSGKPREFTYPPGGYTAAYFTEFGNRLLPWLEQLAGDGCDVLRILRFGVRYTTAHEHLLPWTEADDLVIGAFVNANDGHPFDVVRDGRRADCELDLAGIR